MEIKLEDDLLTINEKSVYIGKYSLVNEAITYLLKQQASQLEPPVMPTLAGKPRIIYKNSRHLKEDKPYGIRDNGGYLFFFVDISHYDGQDERYEEELKQQQLLAEYLLAELSKYSA